MEAIIVIAAVLILCVILGVSAEVILIGVLGLLSAVLLFIFGFFCYCAFRLLQSKVCQGTFLRADKNPKGSFDVAYYDIDGSEYPNALPFEKILRRAMYTENKPVRLLLCEKKHFVFDRDARAAIWVGIVIGGISAAGTIACLVQFI